MAYRKILFRRDTAADWTSTNPILSQGEGGYETDTKKLKIGDGTTAWTSLPYYMGNLDDVGNVVITSAQNGDFLRWNGSAWVNDAVNLSTDTIGSYVESLVAGTGVTLTNNSGEGATPTVAVDTTVIAPLASPTFTGTVSGVTKTMVGLDNVDNTSDANKPVSTATQTALDLKAPLSSPQFEGTPTLPTGTIAVTQSPGSNSTAVATTAFVTTAVANLVDVAPGALNTLNELAAALGDDENFATTVSTNLGLKAPLASPIFTGQVQGVTAVMVGLGNVDNTSDANKPVSTAVQTALDLKANLASPTFTGTVTLPSGTVTSTMILDDTIVNADISSSASIADTKLATISTANKVSNSATTATDANTASAIVARDASGNFTAGTITAALTGNASTATTLQTARNIAGQSFDGSANISIAPTDLTGVTSTAAEINILDGATLSTAELNFVDGVTSAIQTQIDAKAPLASPTFTGTVTIPTGASITAPTGLVKGDVGLGSVDNTTDANKPVSTAQQTALDLKANLASPIFTGTVTVPAPTNNTDAATKSYVDTTVSGVSISSLNDIGDVTITAAANGDYLKWNGTAFVNDDIDLGTDTVGDYVATITGGTGVTSSAATTGEGTTHTLSIGQAVGTSDNVTFAGVTADNIKVGVTGANEIDTVSGDLTIDSAGGTVTVDDNLTVTGNLTVSGTTTSVNTETLTVDDNIIVLNNNATGAPSENAGIEVERGSSTNVALRWNETSDKWEITTDGSTYGDIATETYADAVVTAARIITAAGGDGTAGQALTTNGSGTLDFTTITGTTEASIISAVGGDGSSGQVLKTNGSGNLSFGDVALGTNTTGNYMADVSAGDGITVTHTAGEGSTATISARDTLVRFYMEVM